MIGKAVFRKWVYVAALLPALVLSFHGSGAYPRMVESSGSNGEGELYFTILHTNDEHSALIPHSPAIDNTPQERDPTRGGFARLAFLVEEIRKDKSERGEPVLLFNAGDFLGGSPFGWLAPHGIAAELTIMQEIGYDAVTIGNHEYDYGPEVLAEYLQAAGYPEAHRKTLVLASNTRAPAGHPLAKNNLYLDRGIIELENGLKVGVFGLIGEDALTVAADTGDLEFLDREETARKAVEKLNNQGADIIVALTHAGLIEDRLLARTVSGIDVIVGGHCHTALKEPLREKDTIIVQAGSLLEYLGLLELAYHPESGRVRVRGLEDDFAIWEAIESFFTPEWEDERPFLIPIDHRFPASEGAAAVKVSGLIEAYQLELNRLISEITGGEFNDIMETVARSDFTLSNQPPLQETPAGNFITDAMRLITGEVTGKRVDVAVQANGSIRESIIPGSMEHTLGEISFYDIADVVGLGFGDDGYAGYPIVSMYLTGEEIRRTLEVAVLLEELQGNTYFLQFSGLRYSYNPANAVLFTVPFINQPVPGATLFSEAAVTRAELYTGEGKQSLHSDDYRLLQKDDRELYHVVTDSYILSFLPMAGEMLPGLEITPKCADGKPVPPEDFHRLVVHHENGRELKVWEAVVKYAASQPAGAGGIPQIPDYYREPMGRINQVWSFPLVAWPLLALALITAGIVYLFCHRRRKKLKKRADSSQLL